MKKKQYGFKLILALVAVGGFFFELYRYTIFLKAFNSDISFLEYLFLTIQ